MIVHIIIFLAIHFGSVPVIFHFSWTVSFFTGIDYFLASYLLMVLSVEETASRETSFKAKPKESIIEMSDFWKFGELKRIRRKLEINMIVQVCWFGDFWLSLG